MSASKPRRWGGSSRFKTDTDISNVSSSQQKQLKKWIDHDADSEALEGLTLESGPRDGPWNQFAANKEKFGVVPSYDEHEYTTVVNTAHPDFAAREQRAAALAREIESQAHGGNVHIAEERGIDITTTQDEEDLYSGVQRSSGGGISTSVRQKFAAKEAQRAMASPSYLQNRERNDGHEDLRKFSNEFQVTGEVPADLLPILGQPREYAEKTGEISVKKSKEAEEKPKETDGKQREEKTREEKPKKKKFDFSKSAGKSFKSFSPKAFTPASNLPAAPSAIPLMMPMAMPAMPMSPPMGMPVQPFYCCTPPVEEPVKPVKPMGNAYDYVAVMHSKNESLPPAFVTPPTWPTTCEQSYVDQFPPTPMRYVPIGYMPY